MESLGVAALALLFSVIGVFATLIIVTGILFCFLVVAAGVLGAIAQGALYLLQWSWRKCFT